MTAAEARCRPSAPCGDPACPWCSNPSSNGNGQAAAEEEPRRYVKLTPASTIPMDRPQWLWKGRLPLAAASLVPGREGEGKTALVGHLCARATHGQLEGDRLGRPGDVVYIGYEDDRSTVLIPRLVAAGADLDRFLFVDLPGGAPFSVAIDCGELARACAGRDVVAVVVDPLDAHLGVQDSHRKAEVQASIAKLGVLAQDLRCAGIGIAHFNKGDAASVLLKVVGSVGLTTSVRSVLAVGPHPERPEEEKIAVVAKANMTDRSRVPALRFRVEATAVPHPRDGGEIDTARVVWLGEESGLDADAILAAGTAGERSELQRCVDFLVEYLTADGGGEYLSKEVEDAAYNGHDFSRATLLRAKKKVGVVAVQRDRKWWLSLPSEAQVLTTGSEYLKSEEEPPPRPEEPLF